MTAPRTPVCASLVAQTMPTRLRSIQVLRDTVAHSGVDDLIERITDDLDRYLPTMEPEERDHTRMILERLLDLQAAAVRSATNRGTVMADRMGGEDRQEAA